MSIKQLLVRCIVVIEAIVWVGMYYGGNQGMCAIWHMRTQNHEHERTIVQLRHELALIEKEIAQWHTDPYYKEQYAREQLQMARQLDQVFLLTEIS